MSTDAPSMATLMTAGDPAPKRKEKRTKARVGARSSMSYRGARRNILRQRGLLPSQEPNPAVVSRDPKEGAVSHALKELASELRLRQVLKATGQNLRHLIGSGKPSVHTIHRRLATKRAAEEQRKKDKRPISEPGKGKRRQLSFSFAGSPIRCRLSASLRIVDCLCMRLITALGNDP